MISVELAYIMLHFLHKPNEIKYRFEGRESLRGVMGGVPYPIIWIDMEPEDQKSEIAALKDKEPTDSSYLKAFCEDFINRKHGGLFPPYIPGGGPFVNTMPEGYEEMLQSLDGLREAEEKEFKWNAEPSAGTEADLPTEASSELIKRLTEVLEKTKL